MMRRRRALLRALALAALPAMPVAYAQDPRASLAVATARDWLALADRNEVKGSHAAAGARFRQALSERAWSAALDKERKPQGALLRRTVYQTWLQRSLPGAKIEGDFAVILFRSAFANQQDAIETLTLERESDDVWRVVGYFVR